MRNLPIMPWAGTCLADGNVFFLYLVETQLSEECVEGGSRFFDLGIDLGEVGVVGHEVDLLLFLREADVAGDV